MVSWGFAFKKGAIILLWTILWGIIGGIIGGIISSGSIFAVIGAEDPASALIGAMGFILAGTIIGGLITAIGVFATLVKIVTETVQELK